ncbi:uncharacterized protein F5147DRAFT_768029 [Suillus discolor]|uniref:Uncharacterized protein n=1 Tax=Suillus discolor TaxID=1912936 RepID=A0A9P7JZB7_9AGAM|nr:uncharacterized protein F5147DRAFT_768029 [Suillus discolor]KAG2117888.1 hypothetical protein F5147DRAFT_768029 [Suillus discolor]
MLDDAQDLEDFLPRGTLGDSAERYLQAHGYKVSAVWSIIHAFKDAFGPDDFMAYVCPKGMPVLEAAYIYELISALDPTKPHLKASEIAPKLSKEWKFMLKEDKENMTKDYMDDLKEYRANKSLAVHNVAINSFHDVCSTLDSISVQLSELTPQTEDKLADHFVMLTKLMPHKFATCLKACVISGVTGLVSNYKESYLTLKRELTSLILGKLNQAAQVPIPKMFYNNFNT